MNKTTSTNILIAAGLVTGGGELTLYGQDALDEVLRSSEMPAADTLEILRAWVQS